MWKPGMAVDFLNLWLSQTLKAQDFGEKPLELESPNFRRETGNHLEDLGYFFLPYTLTTPPPKKKGYQRVWFETTPPINHQFIIKDFMPIDWILIVNLWTPNWNSSKILCQSASHLQLIFSGWRWNHERLGVWDAAAEKARVFSLGVLFLSIDWFSIWIQDWR